MRYPPSLDVFDTFPNFRGVYIIVTFFREGGIYRVFQKKYLLGFDIEVDISLRPMKEQKWFCTFSNWPVFVDFKTALNFIPMGIFH